MKVDNLDNCNSCEKLEKQKNNDNGQLLLEFKKGFIFDTLREKNTNDKNSFIENIMGLSSLDKNLKTLLLEYKAKNQEKFNSLNKGDLKEITIYDLQNLLAKDFLTFNKLKNNLKKTILSNYEFDVNTYDNKIQTKLNKKSNIELKNLIKSENILDDFLNGIDNLEISKKENNNIKILNLSQEEKEKRFKNLSSDEEKQEVEQILKKLNITGKISNIDMEYIFETTLLSDIEKKEFVKIYIPFVTLQDLLDLGIIEIDKAKNLKKEILKEIFKNYGVKKDKISNFTYKLNFEDIDVSIDDYLDYSSIIAKNIGFKDFVDNLDQDIEKINQDIIKNGPKTFKEFVNGLKILDKNNRIKNIDNFSKGNFIEFSILGENGKKEISYLKIQDFDDTKKTFSYSIVGSKNQINFSNDKVYRETYVDFINKFNTSKLELNCLTKNDLKTKIDSGELIQVDIEFIDKTKQISDEQKDKYKNQLETEIEDIKKEIDNNLTNQNNTLLNARLNKLNKDINNISSETNENLIELMNLQKLISKIDSLDQDGKNIIGKGGEKGLFKGMILKTLEKGIFEIIGIDDGEIILKNVTGKTEQLDFNNFLIAFESNETKRILKINDFQSLIEDNKNIKENDLGKKWENHEINNGKLVIKNINSKDKKSNDQNVDYLVSDKNDIILKINNIYGDKVNIQIGERKNISSLSEEQIKKGGYKKNDITGEYEGEILYIKGAKEETINLNDLDNYIKENELFPNWQTGKEVENQIPLEPNNKFHNKLSSKIFSLSSIAEIIAGGKLFVDSIKESLKKGNDLKAAKAALAMGKFLPEELKQELKIKVERAESEAMDNELESLGKVDSRIAVERIRDWLLNKNCPEFKKEAGLLFMLEKYGHLTSKRALYEYRGKFLWYEAFGGRIGDEFFNMVQKDAKALNITFSEENLMLQFLKKQCGSSGFMGHKRRSRLHKEFERKWGSGINEEYDKGYSDATNKRTAVSILNGGLEEAMGGTTSNAIGWFKKVIERGCSLENMSEGFFVLLYSGALLDVDQKTFLKIKGIWDEGIPIIFTRFCTNASEMNLFNNTVLELSKRMGEIYGGDIHKDAKELFDDVKLKKSSEKDRIDKTVTFWKKYGTQLSRALNMVNTKDNTYSATDNIIFLEKENNPLFNNYYNIVRKATDDQSFGKDFLDDACGEVGISGLNVNQLAKDWLKFGTTRQLNNEKTGSRVWDEIYNDIISVNQKNISDFDKRRYLLKTLQDLTSGFKSNHTDNFLKLYNDSGTNIGKFFNKINLNIKQDLDNYSPQDILDGEADEVLLNTVDNILNGIYDTKSDDSYENPLELISTRVKDSTNDTLNN